ncbi:MAG TPA: glycosyltransferase family 2 protein [Nitrososphaeraceae archaeon]|nr:glycosyltransferase family 2 protein [Nitrososphaeraceae archaeon]
MDTNSTSPLVSIIIVNYKNYTDLRECLLSLRRSMYTRKEIIVVDNESDDGLLKEIENEFRDVQFYAIKENLNFSEGNNLGIANSKGEIVILLNCDTAVTEGWLEPLVREAIKEPAAFYQPRILFSKRKDTINSIGNAVHVLGFAYPKEMGKNISQISISEEKKEVFYCSGSCVLCSRQILSKLGGLDSNYWTYYDDVNLGWKGRLYGYPSYVVPDSTIYHKWGGVYGQLLSYEKLYLLERGRLSSIARNFTSRSILLLLPAIIFLDIFLIIYLIPKGLAKAKVQATLDFFRNIKLVTNERKDIQTRRITTDKDIARYMTTKIEHPYFEKIPKKIDQLFILISRVIIKML